MLKNRFEVYDEKTLKVYCNDDKYNFLVDISDIDIVSKYKWYVIKNKRGLLSVVNKNGDALHQLMFSIQKGYEVDHKDLNRLNNKRENLRVCTHRENQCNQDVQINNTSGVVGVRFNKARNKYVARIKANGKEIHLGYYENITNATQARNVGMRCMFGEFGVYNKVPKAPPEIEQYVMNKCKCFASNSLNKAFFISNGNHY